MVSTQNPQHLVIVGASLAGLRTAEAARTAGFEGRITMVGSECHVPYDRPPLSKAYLTETWDARPDDLPVLLPPEELAELSVDLLLGEPASALDTVTRTVQVGENSIDYDALVVATGATPRTILDRPVAGIHVLRTIDDARAVRTALDVSAGLVVVGAGFIGLEVASAALKHDLPVTVVEASNQPLTRSVGQQAADILVANIRAAGVNLLCGRTIADIRTEASRVSALELEDGTVLPADLVVCGIGATPAVQWLHGSNLQIEDGIICDPTMATSVRGVWAAGDVARTRRPDGSSGRIEHWTAAAEEGAIAGSNAAAFLAGLATFRHSTSMPYFWSELFGSKFQMLGTATGADTSVLVGDADGPWMMLYGRMGRTTGVLTRDMPNRIMKFRALVANGTDFTHAVEQAAEITAAPAAPHTQPAFAR